jgi:hypothetical protein
MNNPDSNADSQFISLTEFHEFIFEPIVPVGDLLDNTGKPIEKSFPYWRRYGLLPFISKGKWVKLSFAQLIWVRILDTLRSFSYTVADTQKICNYFFKDAYDIELPKKNLIHNKQALEKKAVAGTISDEEGKMLSWINDILRDKALLHILSFNINYLTNLINNSLFSSEDSGMLIFLDGKVTEYIGSEYFNHLDEHHDINAPHIRLSMRHFLLEFIDDDELSIFLLPQLLTNIE